MCPAGGERCLRASPSDCRGFELRGECAAARTRDALDGFPVPLAHVQRHLAAPSCSATGDQLLNTPKPCPADTDREGRSCDGPGRLEHNRSSFRQYPGPDTEAVVFRSGTRNPCGRIRVELPIRVTVCRMPNGNALPVPHRRSPAQPGPREILQRRAGPGLRDPSIRFPGFLRAGTRTGRLQACRDTGRDR